MFIMVAAWRQTNRRLSVEERMGLASDVAVSITITSVTDALAFCIGAITPLPAVRVFCLYAGVAITFDYLFQITFFGACMVYTGQRESNGQHCFTCQKVLPREQAPSRSYVVCCAGGVSREFYKKNPDEADHQVQNEGITMVTQTSIKNGWGSNDSRQPSTVRWKTPQSPTIRHVYAEAASKTSCSQTDSEQAILHISFVNITLNLSYPRLLRYR